jgi:hypothetical protein
MFNLKLDIKVMFKKENLCTHVVLHTLRMFYFGTLGSNTEKKQYQIELSKLFLFKSIFTVIVFIAFASVL